MNFLILGVLIGLLIGFVVLIVIAAIRLSNNLTDKLHNKIAEAYQIVGVLANIAGLHDHPDVQRALDHFAEPDKFLDESLLPWYPKPEPTDEAQP